MNLLNRRTPRGSTRSLARLATATLVAAAFLAGCGQETKVEQAPHQSAFDQSLHDRLPEAVRAAGVVRVATDASYAPASYFASDGRTIIGFEPDLAAAMGKVLGVRFEFVNADFQTVLPRLTRHQVDAVISAMTDTPDREKQADFVDYFNAGTAILVQRGNPQGVTDLKDLCGKVVAVEEGTVQVDLLKRSQRGCAGTAIDIKTYPTNSDALLQLRTGRAVAVLNDYPPAALVATDIKTRAHYQLASNIQYEPGPYGIAVAKDDTALRDVLRDALAQLIRGGEYAEVLHRWNVGDGALQASSINGAQAG
jgi:polar amino acid transport system substrate-binding protein